MKMKLAWLALIVAALFNSLKAQEMDSLSYSVGVLMAQSLKQQGLEKVDASALAKGIEDVLNGNPLTIDLPQANQQVQHHMQGQREKEFAANVAEGKAFLAENAKRPEVTTTESGLQYEVMVAGDGPLPQATDKVTVHYHGSLLDGTVFDSSVERGEPATFGVTQVIQGWVEALQLMPLGSKWKLFIPSDLAYGERGAGQKIGPFSTLIFEVELLKIN
ncbi:MAG: peptidyl-prolyl cis-trans isomerase [Saprospiraceae bacterium]|nr:MAG: peptidyl-prolyl cis-trans isomerase [Saprospiraceae bacterium]